jgi:hypothetical protein
MPTDRRQLAGLVYLSVDGQVDVNVPLPIEVIAVPAGPGRNFTPGPCPCACNTLDQPCGGCGHAGCGRR